MSNFDLNKPADFAKLTMSPIANVAFQLAGLDPSKWDIKEASYNAVKFHVFISKEDYNAGLSKVSDKGGRRKVKYLYPYKDGQTTDDLGRKGYTYEFDAILHGQNYEQGLTDLLTEFDDPTSGTLVHPLYGEIEVVIEDWELTHEHESRQAVKLHLVFSEHNFSIGEVNDLSGGSSSFLKKALNDALAAFAMIENVITEIQGKVTLANTIRSLLVNGMEYYKTGFAQNLAKINATFNPPKKNKTIQDVNNDLSSITHIAGGGNRKSDGTLASTTARVSISPSDPFASVPLDDLRLSTISAINTKQAINDTNVLRDQATDLIKQLKSTLNGQGSLEFFDQINAIKSSVILMQKALETGIKSSRFNIIKYDVPRTMSLREVAFLNGVALENVSEIEILNPFVLSTNFVEKGTVLQVPTK